MDKKLYIKGFDKDLKCRDFQFEIGKEYDTGYTNNLELCTDRVFHFCETIEQVHRYYDCAPKKKNRYCYIEALSNIVSDGEKCGSNKIKIVREIKGKELDNLLMLKKGNAGVFNSGYCNSGDCNSGNYNSGNRNSGNYNSGNRNSGYYNSGYYNSGDCNSGDYNSGNYNSGNRNSGYCNSGNYNSGNRNSGDCNSGNYNSGYYNSGYYNSGDCNSCDYSTGFFNSKEQPVFIFNKPSNISRYEFNKKYSNLFDSFTLTEWIWYTDEEMKNSIIRQATKGYLKKYTYYEAWANLYKGYSDKDKKTLFSIPNFDVEVFKEITNLNVSSDYERLVKSDKK